MNLTIEQALGGLVAAAIAGGVATATGIVLAMAVPTLGYGLPSLEAFVASLVMAAVLAGGLSIYTIFVFAVGLCVVGLPAWAVLDRLGCRTRTAATLAGGVLTSATVAALGIGFGGSGPGVAVFAALMVLPGGLAGWTLHRVAYGKPGQAVP